MALKELDLIVDDVYQGSRYGNASDDPLPQLLGVDSGAGFRHLGKRPETEDLNLLVLKSNFNDPDWPDNVDIENGILTYYGDNKAAKELHDTPRQGNLILRNLFDARHSTAPLNHFPPIFVFGGTGEYRDVRFLGLAVPGAQYLGPDDDLVAIWRSKGPKQVRFLNYKSIFTILDVSQISREWINDIKQGKAATSAHAPQKWLEWLKSRKYSPLLATHSIETRNKNQQLPQTKPDQEILQLLYDKYRGNPFGFEDCAVAIARLFMPNIGNCETTRPWRDGGRDAIGSYRIGNGPSSIDVDFSIEAKCYKPGTAVGVKELGRLLSRLRHRQFGVLVTTSYVSPQAYKELKEDKHPVVIISGSDIVTTLKSKIGSVLLIKNWLSSDLTQNSLQEPPN